MAMIAPGPRSPDDASWSFRSLSRADGPALAEIRAVAMRPSLERLGRFDDVRVRERFLTGFDSTCTWGVVVDDEMVGCVTLRPEHEEFWLENFLLRPEHQGQGIGGQVLRAVLECAGGTTVRLDVLQGSEARDLYERSGFIVDHQDAIDVYMVRHFDR